MPERQRKASDKSIYDGSTDDSYLDNVTFESWRQEFLADVESLLDDEKKRFTQIKYASFSNALSNAIQYLVATKAIYRGTVVQNTEIHIDRLFYKINQVTNHMKALIDCDQRCICYFLVADDFVHCERLSAWHKDIKSFVNPSLLHDLTLKVIIFQKIYAIVRKAFHDAYIESFERESTQQLLNRSQSRGRNCVDLAVDDACSDDSICMFDLIEGPNGSNVTTLMHSLSNLTMNKKSDLGSLSTCSTSTSTLPDHSCTTEDGISQDVMVKCFQWYGRMGQPNRQDMKRFILKEHPEITPQDIDKLPWKSNGRRLDMSSMTLNFLHEEFSLSFTSHEGTTQQISKKNHSLLASLFHILASDNGNIC